jgi:cysteine-rich repeat protein
MAGGGTGGKPEPPEPVCGNGKLEAGEECDDAGHEGKDGCDASCQVVCSHFGEGSVKSEDAHCYLGFDENDFEGATADCAARGGHLVSISSAAENEIVSTFVRNSKWIGGFEDVAITNPGDGLYEWVTGEPFAYENWADEEPDRAEFRCSSGGGSGVAIRCYQHCALMQGGGTWIDSRCDMADGYVCEWEPAGD